jgi:hypothetical protein
MSGGVRDERALEHRERPLNRIAVISSHYYPHYLSRSTAFTREVVNAVGATACVFVGSQAELTDALEAAATSLRCSAVVARHDNVGLEFGAYQLGIEEIKDLPSFDWLLIINDSFSSHEPFPAQRLKNASEQIKWRLGERAPVAIGKIEGRERSFTIEGIRAYRWLTSNFVVLNRGAVEGLRARIYCPELEDLIVESDDPDRFFAPELDVVLRQHISHWLFDPSERFHWYRASPLTSANRGLFARKARSILQEIYLSARLDALSTAFVDVGWLGRWQRWALRVLPRKIGAQKA